MYNSYIPALITPFKNNLDVDYKVFENLINYQLKNNIQTFLVNGTTAESPALTEDEKLELLQVAHSVIKDNNKIIFGAGSNCTKSTIDFVNKVEKLNLASTVLLVVPYYNKPNQDGLFEHFKTIARNTNLKIMLYNVPSRTCTSLDVKTVVKLSGIENIVAIKDAVDDFSRVFELQNKIKSNFYLTSGEDATAFAYFASGGSGCVSVTANVLPKHCVDVYNKTLNGDYKKARELHAKLVNVHKAMFCQASPAPIKYALSLLNLCGEHVRLPLSPLSKENKVFVRKCMEEIGIF